MGFVAPEGNSRLASEVIAEMASDRIVKALLCAAGMMFLSGCDEDGGGAAPATPVALSPPPTPAPSPPTPAPPIQVVGASPGQILSGSMACAKDPVLKNSEGHVTGLPVLTGAKTDNTVTLLFRATDSYDVDVNGFGGSAFAPADKRRSPTEAFDQFINGAGDEFYITKSNALSGSRTFVTHGLYNAGGLCFFGAGLPAVSMPAAGSGDYFALADGIAQIAGQTLRLLPSTESALDVNFQTGAATLRLSLSGRSNAFEDFANRPSSNITTATASLQLRQGGPGFAPAALIGSGGFSGTVTGSLVGDTRNTSGNGGSGAVFTFELRNAAGDVIFGVATAERNLI